MNTGISLEQARDYWPPSTRNVVCTWCIDDAPVYVGTRDEALEWLDELFRDQLGMRGGAPPVRSDDLYVWEDNHR